jgi:folate-binding protein YgfZ
MAGTADQYHTIAEGVGWLDRTDRGRIRFAGADRVSFLQALLTNDIAALRPGLGLYAAWLTPQGRMIADLRIHHCGEELLAQVEAGTTARLVERFDQLIFTENVRVSNDSRATAQISVIGKNAPSVLAHAFGLTPLDPEQLITLPVLGHLRIGDVMVARSDESELPAFDIFVPQDERAAAVSRLEEMGAVPAPLELLDALRIEAGRPLFGVDMTEETIPLEAGLLERAISTTKGCYVGQEIVIRILHRGGGRVAKRLVRLRFDDSLRDVPPAGTPLVIDGQSTGRITSAALSPSTGRVIALGYLPRERAEAGGQVTIEIAGAKHAAEIIGLAG